MTVDTPVRAGRLVYLGGCGAHHAAPNHTIYDHRIPDARKLWVQNVVDVAKVSPELFGGVFCDRSGSIRDIEDKDLGCYEFGEGELRKWDVGHWQAVADTQAG